MQLLTQSPILGFLEPYQWILVAILIGLIIFYVQYRKKQM